MMQKQSRQVDAWRRRLDSDSSGQRPSHRYNTTPGRDVQELRAGASGKMCAAIEGDTLRKTVLASKHFLRKPPAIAFDVAILDAARQAGVERVEVLDRESGRNYTATLADFDRFGVSLNRGFGVQLALPLARWQVRRPSDGIQLSLFGGAP